MTAEEADLTVREVNQRLPLVRAIVADVVGLKADLLERQRRLRELQELHPGIGSDESPYAEEVVAMRDGLEDDEQRLAGYEAELRSIGGVLIDARSGLVEFPSELDGRSVWLSWLLGETEVTFWRELTDAAAERRPLLHGLADVSAKDYHSES